MKFFEELKNKKRNNFKKGISPVVATSLLLVVAVSAVVFFQGWFSDFSSSVFTDIEIDSNTANSNVGVNDVIGSTLYVNAGSNLSIDKIEINGFDCNYNGSISGLSKINISACLENVSGEANVVVFTNQGVYESYEFVDSGNVVLSGGSSPPPSSCSASTPEGFSSGTGTLGDPFGICDCTQLQLVKDYLAGNFTLENNIDCSDTVNWNLGAGFIPIGTFSNGFQFVGSLNGNGFNVDNLFISNSTDYVGLFGHVTGNFNLSNINLNNVNITGNNRVGAALGSSYGYSSMFLDNVAVTGKIYGASNVGGLVGYAYYNKISNTYSGADIVGSGSNVGGLVGNLKYNSVTSNSYSNGDVKGSSSVGGLVGYLGDYAQITNSYSTSNTNGSSSNVGGLVGYSAQYNTIITNSYSSGDVTGNMNVGGLVGYKYEANGFPNSFTVSQVSGSSVVAGVLGISSWGNGSPNVYWNNFASNPNIWANGADNDGHVITILDNEAYFYSQASPVFATWDTNIWEFSGSSLPTLK